MEQMVEQASQSSTCPPQQSGMVHLLGIQTNSTFVQDLGLVPFVVRIEVQIVMWESQSYSEDHEAGFVQELGILEHFRFLGGLPLLLLIGLFRFSSIFLLLISGPAGGGFGWRRDLREWVQDVQVDWQVVMFRWEWVELLMAR